MSRVVCIVQARLNSKRLPSKVLLPLNGHTVIGEVLTRCKRIPGVDEVVCAIPISADDLGFEAHKYAKIYNGWPKENDVLGRYYGAAEEYNADIIMRITGDCPLISPELCGEVLRRYRTEDVDYASNIEPRTFPRGLDCEVFGFGMLTMAHEQAMTTENREHVTPWIKKHSVRGACVQAPWPIEGRLCIDTEEDYKVIKAYFDEADQHIRAA